MKVVSQCCQSVCIVSLNPSSFCKNVIMALILALFLLLLWGRADLEPVQPVQERAPEPEKWYQVVRLVPIDPGGSGNSKYKDAEETQKSPKDASDKTQKKGKTLNGYHSNNISKYKAPNPHKPIEKPTEEYHGFTVPGWPPHRSLLPADYMNFKSMDALLVPKLTKPMGKEQERLSLLIGVQSAPGNRAPRDEVRRTWGGRCRNRKSDAKRPTWCQVFFSLGRTSNSTLQRQIEEESLKFGDILQDRFMDSYNNLTLKTLHILRFFENSPDFRHLFKTDDDSYVNLEPLKNALKNEVLSEHKDLMGFLQLGSPKEPKISSAVAKSRPVSHKPYARLPERIKKWVVPKYMYSEQRYPPFLSGSGYLMTKKAAKCILKESKDIKIIHLEDVYVTGVCAEACDIVRYHHKGFDSKKKKVNYQLRPYDILLHYMTGRMDNVNKQARKLFPNDL